jgi:putative phosphoserine phosphatase/1-acylglycerol-3-phosphate O-acyltransferase
MQTHVPIVPIVPIVVRDAGELMARNDKMPHSGTLAVVVHPPIDVAYWHQQNPDERVLRCDRPSSARLRTGR